MVKKTSAPLHFRKAPTHGTSHKVFPWVFCIHNPIFLQEVAQNYFFKLFVAQTSQIDNGLGVSCPEGCIYNKLDGTCVHIVNVIAFLLKRSGCPNLLSDPLLSG